MARRRAAAALAAVLVAFPGQAAADPSGSPTNGAIVSQDLPAACPGQSFSQSLGREWPLILVHGFGDSADAWQLNAENKLCLLPDVYTTAFDYRSVDKQWVNDPAIGPALAQYIEKLASRSRREGGPGRVLLVGHSMGGLAIRCALSSRCLRDHGPAAPLSDVAAVETIGTPNYGSFLEKPVSGPLAAAVGSALKTTCSVSPRTLGTLGDVLCPFVSALNEHAPALEAFVPGSADLAQLDGFPQNLPVLAVAGSVRLTTNLFGIPVSVPTTDADVGDLVVSRSSALADANPSNGFGGPRTIDCGSIALNVAPAGVLPDLSGVTCVHIPEPRTSAFVDQIEAMVAHFVVAPVTRESLLSAPVPALRGNPAGNLRDGVLNGPHDGQTELELTGGAAPTFGDLTGDGVDDGAAVLGSSSGVGGGDQYVDLYTNGDHRLGQFDPTSVDPDADHAAALGMIIRSGYVLLDWETQRETGDAYWSGKLAWDGHSIVLSDLAHHTGIAGQGLWTDSSLTISPAGLGAVRLGMSLDQAQQAAGIPFDGQGDGATYPTELPAGYPHDYVGGAGAGGRINCVGTDGSSSAQRVTTSAGIGVGSSAEDVVNAYGSQAAYEPLPPGGGLDPHAGYLVRTVGGAIAFALDTPHGDVTAITAGGGGLTVNSCPG